jgi:hypothetical protein
VRVARHVSARPSAGAAASRRGRLGVGGRQRHVDHWRARQRTRSTGGSGGPHWWAAACAADVWCRGPAGPARSAASKSELRQTPTDR